MQVLFVNNRKYICVHKIAMLRLTKTKPRGIIEV